MPKAAAQGRVSGHPGATHDTRQHRAQRRQGSRHQRSGAEVHRGHKSALCLLSPQKSRAPAATKRPCVVRAAARRRRSAGKPLTRPAGVCGEVQVRARGCALTPPQRRPPLHASARQPAVLSQRCQEHPSPEQVPLAHGAVEASLGPQQNSGVGIIRPVQRPASAPLRLP
eukprot:scaffold7863_cov118-Isochrysis_galbana.AAC.5